MASAAAPPTALAPVTLLRALDSPLTSLLVFSAETAAAHGHGQAAAARPQAQAAREPVTVYLVAEPLPSSLAQSLRGLCALQHPSLIGLRRVESARSLSAVTGFLKVARPEHRSWSDRPATMLVADEDRAAFRSLAQFIHERRSAAPVASTPTVGLLLCMRALLEGVQALHATDHAHGFINPSWILFSDNHSLNSTPLRLAGVGVQPCLKFHDLQSLASSSPYVRSDFRPADLHSPLKLKRADLFAAARCMLDLACMRLSTTKLVDSAPLLQEVQQAHGADVSALFHSALADTPLAQLLTSINACLASRSYVKPERGGMAMAPGPQSLIRASSSPSVSSGASAHAAAAATASASAATGAAAFFPDLPSAATPGALAAAAPSSFNRALSAQSESDWRIVRAVFQGTRTPKLAELLCHVNTRLPDAVAFAQLNSEVQSSFGVGGQPAVCLCHETSFAPVAAGALLAELRATAPNSNADTPLVLLVFDAGAERRLYSSIQQDISFQPHHSMVTEDPGEYARASSEKKNALPIAWSLGEFVDNSISAQRHNPAKGLPRSVSLKFLEYTSGGSSDWVLVVEDEGEGLNRETLKHFATFGASRKVRQLERTGIDPEAPDYLSGQIGEFGVGSKQAAFFSQNIDSTHNHHDADLWSDGRALSVVTAQDNERHDATSSVLELEIAADKMEAASQRQANPYRGVVNSRRRGAIDQSHLDPALLQRGQVRDLILHGETGKRQFTRIIVSQVHKSHHKKLLKRQMIVHELIRLYQFYLYGIGGVSGIGDHTSDSDGPQSASGAGASSSSSVPASAAGIKISLAWYRNDKLDWSTDDLSRVMYDKSVTLSSSLAFMLLKRGTPFHFFGKLRDNDDHSKFTVFSGTINYYPFTEGEESHPDWSSLEGIEVQANRRTGTSAAAAIDVEADDGGSQAGKKRKSAQGSSAAAAAVAAAATPAVAVGRVPAPVFECTWNGRVIPESQVHSLRWIDEACRGKMAQCRFRLKGVLHFVDNVFLRPSKNKLSLSRNDLSVFINSASFYLPSSSEDGRKQNRRSGTVDLPAAFASWLKTQHERLDREIQVDEETAFTQDDRVHYTRFSFRLGDEEIMLSAGDIISMSKSKEFGRLTSYSLKDENSTAGALLHYLRLPRQVHHEQPTQKSVQQLDLLTRAAIAHSYKVFEQAQLKSLPEKIDVKVKIVDAAHKKLALDRTAGSTTEFPAGVRFEEQEVNALGHADERGHRDNLRGLRILRGVFRRVGAGGARNKRKAGDLAEHLPDHTFFGPVGASYITRQLNERTVFDPFEINKAGEYLIEYSIAEMNWIKSHTKFTVAPGAPTSLLVLKPARAPTLALGQSWLPRAISVKFEDQFKNECDCGEMMQRFIWQLSVAGKVNAVAKHLEFACRLSSAEGAGRGAAAAAAGATSIPAPDSKTIWLDLQVLVADGQRVSLHGAEDLSLRLQLLPRVAIKRAGAAGQVPFEATFDVQVVAGAPASLRWTHLPGGSGGEVDDDDEPMVEVDNGRGACDLQVQVCDMAQNPVAFNDATQRKLHLSIDLPSIPPHLTGSLVGQGQTALVDRDGIARFRGVLLGVQSTHFRSVAAGHIDVPVRVHLPGTNLRSPPLIVRVQASRMPREIRVQPDRTLVDDSRTPRQKTRRSAGAAGSSASPPVGVSADAASPDTDGPVTLLGSVGSELPLRFSLYDEAGREVSIADLQSELGQAHAHARGAAEADGEETDVEMDVDVMAAAALVLAPQDDDVDMADAVGAATTPRRKRKLSARAIAAAASSPKRRMRAALVDGSACELQVKGLSGVTHCLLSSLAPDGSLWGVKVPARVSGDIEASLLLTLPQGVLHCDFIVRPLYDAPVALECRVLATASIDDSLADAVALIYCDRFGNVVPAPLAALQVDVEPVGGVGRAEAAAAAAAAEGDEPDGSGSKQSFTISAAAATSPQPLAGVRLNGARVGTYAVTCSIPSLPHLSANAHVQLTVGAVSQLRFTTADVADACDTLTLQLTTRSFLPAFRILACDAGGNVCTGVEGEVTLKSALLPQPRKLQLRNGECGIAANSTIVRYSTPHRMVPISVHMSVGAAASANRSHKKGSSSSAAGPKLNRSIAVNIGATRKLVHKFAPSAEELAALVLRADGSWPAIRVLVEYEAEGDALEASDIANFTLSVEKRVVGRGAGAGVAAAASRYQYPAGRLDANGALVFEAPPGELVRHAGEHKFTLRFEEHDAALLAVMLPPDIQREQIWLAHSIPGTPVAIERAAVMSPPERLRVGLTGAHATSTRRIATAVTFSFLDQFGNILSEAHLQQMLPVWAELCTRLQMDVCRTDAAGPSPLPELLPVEIVSHAHHVEIPSLSVSVGASVPMGAYAVTFAFPHLPGVAIEPLPFDISDNSELALVRAQVSERMDKQRRKLAASIKERNEATALLKEQQDRMALLQSRLAKCSDGLPANATPQQVQAALETETAHVAANTVRAEVPQRYRISEEVRERLRVSGPQESPDWIGPLIELAAPLRNENDCRIISWHLQARLRGHLLRRTGVAHAELRAHSLPCLKLDQCVASAPPQPPPAGTPGNPRLVSELLCAGVNNADFVTCMRIICKGLLVMDNMATAQAYCKQLAQRGVTSPIILCLAEMETISGGWDDSSRNAPSLAQLRNVFGSFGVRPSQARVQALQHRQRLLADQADTQQRLAAAADAVAHAEAMEAEATKANKQLTSLQHEMDRSKTVPPQLPVLLAALAAATDAAATGAATGAASRAVGVADTAHAEEQWQGAAAAAHPTGSAASRTAHRSNGPPRRGSAAHQSAHDHMQQSAAAAASAAPNATVTTHPPNGHGSARRSK